MDTLVTKNAVEMVKVQSSGILQPALFGSKTQQPLASDLGSEHLKHICQGQKVQNGDTKDYQTLSAKRRMGHIAGLQRRLFPYPHTSKIKKYLRFAYQG